MPVPVLIDTDMGIDDAAAVCLALAADAIDLRAIVGVGGSVELDQVMSNVARLLQALQPPALPLIGRGLEPPARKELSRRESIGADGFGESKLPGVAATKSEHSLAAYRSAVKSAKGELVVVAIGPLTNLAAILRDEPELLRSVRHVYIRGGAVWTRGDATEKAEFNFCRDPEAAAALLTSGLPITVVPLDVTNFILLDESNAAQLAKSGYRTGEILAAMLAYPLARGGESGTGKVHLHDAVAVASILWPDLFLKTRMRLEVTAAGAEAGRSKPALGGDKTKHVNLLTAVNAVDLLENILESLCHEAFVV